MRWDLKPLFEKEEDGLALLEKAQKMAKSFEKKYKGKLSKQDVKSFSKLLERYEEISEMIGRSMTYGFLLFAEDSTKGGIYARFQELATKATEHLLFFDIEFNKIPQKSQKSFIKKCKQYSFYLESIADNKPHLLSLEEERVLLKKSRVGADSFSRLFDEYLSSLKFELDGKKVSEEEVLTQLYSSDREKRKGAAKSLTDGLNGSSRLLTFIYNMIRTDTEIEREMRQYEHPEDMRHLDNKITKKSVDSLIEAVNKNFGMVHRYYTLKSKLLGIKKLQDYDRYAPIGKSEVKYSFEEAKSAVLESFGEFSPLFENIANEAFEGGWMDVYPRDNKRGGAFSHGATPEAHPYILLNHTDGRRDVFTLAHELGHTIHQYLSSGVGYLNADTPLTTAETASVFCEMLLFEKMKNELSGEELISLYAGKLEDIFATLFRQIVFTNFERRVHAKEGELSTEEISEIWQEENKRMFGDSLELSEDYKIWWSYIPHFVHTPFYCYAYSYGQLLVLALYGLYKRGFEDFELRYIEFLSRGGSKSPKDLVGLFGFNIESEKFWEIGLKGVEAMVEEFEEIVKNGGER